MMQCDLLALNTSVSIEWWEPNPINSKALNIGELLFDTLKNQFEKIVFVDIFYIQFLNLLNLHIHHRSYRKMMECKHDRWGIVSTIPDHYCRLCFPGNNEKAQYYVFKLLFACIEANYTFVCLKDRPGMLNICMDFFRNLISNMN